MKENEVNRRISEMSLTQFIAMHEAYNDKDDFRMRKLFKSIVEADNSRDATNTGQGPKDNAYSASKVDGPSGSSPLPQQSNTPSKGDDEKTPTPWDELKKKLDAITGSSSYQKGKNLVNALGTTNSKNESVEEDDVQEEMGRLKKLAGIEDEQEVDETSSGGCTGAGAVASAPQPVGKIHKRRK
jgi:hypothetical protein